MLIDELICSFKIWSIPAALFIFVFGDGLIYFLIYLARDFFIYIIRLCTCLFAVNIFKKVVKVI